ncbi:unnamed protein product [Brassica napus]|uniref:(rape) hypothetical protein n=1 Tax=Brassica napus TaxID=3708 RepID=A0A816X7H1_BRANA|nr:unnamed protein product [Brassica napus]
MKVLKIYMDQHSIVMNVDAFCYDTTLLWYIDFTGSIMGSRDRNHSSNTTGDISVTTQSEERKRCSFNAYLYNQPTGSATYIRQTELSLTA